MRFLLIAPFKRGIARHEESVPVGLGYLATALRRLGHEPDLKDCIIQHWGINRLLDYIAATKPDIIGAITFSQALRNVEEIFCAIKERFPRVVTIAGGPHPSAAPEHSLRFLRHADFAVKGEGEIPLEHLMPILESGRGDFKAVPGLIWRQDDKVLWNENMEYEDIDQLGFPAWDLIQPPLYFDSPDIGQKSTVIHTSRGCPFGCGFCVKLGRRLRHHSIERVYEQIEILNQRYGVSHFMLGDEGFPINRQYVKDFCRFVIEKGKRYTYFVACGLRLNSIDEEMCDLMRKARFTKRVGIGIEAGSVRVRELMKKNLPEEVIYRGISILNKYGFMPSANFILGYPGETRKEMAETIKLARKLKIYGACFAPFIPLPGTQATEQLIRDKQLAEDFDYSQIDLDSVLYAPVGMTKKELNNIRKKAVFLFNIQPRMLFYHMTGGRLLWSIIKVMRIFLPQFLVPKAWRRYS